DEFTLSLWLKSNRPNIQLLCRMVLPKERDPADPSRPLTVVVRCDPYQSTRWKMVTLPQAVKRLREQQQLLTHRFGRAVVTTGAYIDQLVLNVYDGPGVTEVWIDDLEVGPVEETRTILPEPAARPGVQATPTIARRNAEVQLRNNGGSVQLFVSGKSFLLRGIRYTGSPPLRTPRDAGINAVWLDESTTPGLIEEAANRGFWIVPTIVPPRFNTSPSGSLDAHLASSNEFGRKVSRFLEQDAVLAWDLGS